MPSNLELLPAIEFDPPGATPVASVIWLHGLGADGSDFAPVPPYLGLSPECPVRFVFPHAPAIPVTCNGGYVMPAWYDILEMDGLRRKVDRAGIEASVAAIRRLIARENGRGISSARIFLAGFSQGGAVAYTAALTHPEPLAGVIALSTYLPLPELLTEAACLANRHIPLFAAHGAEDDVVRPALGEQARDLLRERGYAVHWQTYPDMPHAVCAEELADIGRWLNARFAAWQSNGAA